MTEKNKDTNVPTPDKTIDVMDAVYLAIVWAGAHGKPAPMALTHIYMLVCPRVNKTQFSLNPEIKIATFANPRSAEIYYKTILAAQKYQQTLRGPKMIMEMYEDEIAQFNQRVR